MKNTMQRLFVVCCLSLMMACQPKKGEGILVESLQPIEKIDSLFRNQHQQHLFHGGVVVSHRGEVLYENYLGIADRSWNIPMQKNVKFDIASVNKSMIAALVLKAVEEGKLHLDDKLVDLLSGFSYDGDFHSDISLHHLLSHSSGLPDYDGVAEEFQKNQYLKFKRLRFTNEEYVNFISKIEPIGEPNTQFHYSNFAYHLLCIILEKIYTKPFATILKEKLTDPLGLENTVSEDKNEIVISKLAKAYNYENTTGIWHQNPFIDLSLGRRVFSTTSDLNRWAQVMDNPGYLTKHSLKLMKQNHLVHISKEISYGYGWVVIDSENRSEMGDLTISKPYIIHGGKTDGYKAMLININEGEYIISFLSNVGSRTQEMQLAKELAHILIK